jgi:hypothetical protein
VIKSPSGIRRVLRALGPGVTTGAADDDPSGVSTYSVAGAQFGTAFLWSALITWPLMGCVQMMCARIGMVTGMGLAGALRANQLARYAWPSGPRARSQAESGLGTGTMSNTLHRHYGQIWPASVRNVPLFENHPLIPTEGASKNHEKNASSWR